MQPVIQFYTLCFVKSWQVLITYSYWRQLLLGFKYFFFITSHYRPSRHTLIIIFNEFMTLVEPHTWVFVYACIMYCANMCVYVICKCMHAWLCKMCAIEGTQGSKTIIQISLLFYDSTIVSVYFISEKLSA